MIDSRPRIIGLAIGDAMGVPLEFCMREMLMSHPTTEMKENDTAEYMCNKFNDVLNEER